MRNPFTKALEIVRADVAPLEIPQLPKEAKGAVDTFHHELLRVGTPPTVGDMYPQRYGEISPAVAKRIYSSSALVNGLIQIGANAFSSAPIKVDRVTGANKRTRLYSGYPTRILDWVNNRMTTTELQRTIYSWMKLMGECILAIEETPPEFASISKWSIYPLDPEYTYVVTDPETGVQAYVYEYNGPALYSTMSSRNGSSPDRPHRIYIPANRIIHLRNFNPHDYWLGNVDLNTLAMSLQIEQYTKKRIRNFNGSAAVLHGVLSSQEQIGADEIQRLKDDFYRQYAGARNAYRVLILEKGMTYQPLQPSNADQFVDQVLSEVRSDVSLVLGVPIALFTGEFKGGKVAEFESLMWKYNILPLMSYVSEMLTKRLALPIAQNLEVGFDTGKVDALRIMELQNERTSIARLLAGKTSPNEERMADGLPPWSDEYADFADAPKPVFDAQRALATVQDQRTSETGASPSMPLPGDAGRDQSEDGEAQMPDSTGQKTAELFSPQSMEWLKDFVDGE